MSSNAIRSILPLPNDLLTQTINNRTDIIGNDLKIYTFKAKLNSRIDCELNKSIANEVIKDLKVKKADGKANIESIVGCLLLNTFELAKYLGDNKTEELTSRAYGYVFPTTERPAIPQRYSPNRIPERNRAKVLAIGEEILGLWTVHRGASITGPFGGARSTVVVPDNDLIKDCFEILSTGAYSVTYGPPGDPVELEDSKGQLVDYIDTKETISSRRLIELHADVIKRHSWTFTPIKGKLSSIPIADLELKRLFKGGDFKTYGRWHCKAQHIPSAHRKTIRIDGKPSTSLDYSGMSLNIAYGILGKYPPAKDVYFLEGVSRSVVKAVALRILNCKSEGEAIRSLNASHKADSLLTDRPNYRSIIKEFTDFHSAISPFFFAGRHHEVFYKESTILMEIIARLLKKHMPILPIHDGIVVPATAGDLSCQIMREAFERNLGFSPTITRD